MLQDAPIGVFDSGVGGLTVAREIMSQLPNEKIVYFGDTARVPYGSKSKKTVISYTRQVLKFLETKEVKAIVIACNTACALAFDAVKSESNVPVIGVVKPGAKAAAAATRNGRIGIIATEATIRSGIYEEFLSKTNPEVHVYGKACPLFVPLVEEGLLEDSVTIEIARRYLKFLSQEKIDTLVLGCTHYPLIRNTLQEVAGREVTLVNPAYETAKSLKEMLLKYNIQSRSTEPAVEHKFYVSDDAEKFKVFANTILPCNVEQAKDINIEQY